VALAGVTRDRVLRPPARRQHQGLPIAVAQASDFSKIR